MISATTRSGQPLPVPKTPAAANITATFPNASLRLHSQTDRMSASPLRKAYSITATPAFATNASTAITPIVKGSGGMPLSPAHTVLATTKSPNAAIDRPFTIAARERHIKPIDNTASEIA